jgi:hypothetical protein
MATRQGESPAINTVINQSPDTMISHINVFVAELAESCKSLWPTPQVVQCWELCYVCFLALTSFRCIQLLHLATFVK